MLVYVHRFCYIRYTVNLINLDENRLTKYGNVRKWKTKQVSPQLNWVYKCFSSFTEQSTNICSHSSGFFMLPDLWFKIFHFQHFWSVLYQILSIYHTLNITTKGILSDSFSEEIAPCVPRHRYYRTPHK